MDILKLKHLDPHELFDNFDECVRMTLCREPPHLSAPVKVNVNLKSAFEETTLHLSKASSKPYFGASREQEKKRLLQDKENYNPNLNASFAADIGSKKLSRGLLRPVDAASKERYICGSRPQSDLIDINIPSESSLPIDRPRKVEKKMSLDASNAHSSNIVMLKKLIKEAVSRPASINTSVDGSKYNGFRELAPNRSKLFKGTGLGTSSVDNLRAHNERKPLGIMTSHVQNTSRISGLFQANRLADSRLKQGSRSGLFRKKDSSYINHSSFNDGTTNLNPKKDISYLEQFKQRYVSSKNHRSYSSMQPCNLDNKSTESKKFRTRHLTDQSEYLTIADDKLISHAGRYRTEGHQTACLEESAADTLREVRLKKYIEISNIYNNFRKMLEVEKAEDQRLSKEPAPARQLADPPAASQKPARVHPDSSTARYMRFEKRSHFEQRPAANPKPRTAGDRLKLFVR